MSADKTKKVRLARTKATPVALKALQDAGQTSGGFLETVTSWTRPGLCDLAAWFDGLSAIIATMDIVTFGRSSTSQRPSISGS